MNTLISVIIVSHNSMGFLEQCLESIFLNQHGISLEVIVVDNGSSDKSKENVEKDFPNVILIKNDRNLGFARACNQGLRISKAKRILFLNPDTIIKDDVFPRCMEFMGLHPEIGLMGCKLVDFDGRLQPSCADFPYMRNIFLDHILRLEIFPPTIKGKLLTKYGFHDKIREVDWVLGAFMLTRRGLMRDMGGMDEDFFLYGEDLDLCYRIWKAGWKIVYYPHAEVLHHGNQVWDTERVSMVYDSLLKFYSKHFSIANSRLLKLLIMVKLLFKRQYF